MASDIQREPKRTRQACLNCRRKKTRCQGERPSCSLCVRLGQICEYPSTYPLAQHPGASHIDPSTVDLSARVAKLEAELKVAKQGQDSNNEQQPAIFDTAMPDIWCSANTFSSPLQLYQNQDQTQPHGQLLSTPTWTELDRAGESSPFSELPPLPVLSSLIDMYFQHCHNQPYCFFHESTLRRRFMAEELPLYLLLAISATAARYSSHDYFKGCQMEAVGALSRAAWHIILDQVFATNQESELATAQATSLLAVIDFTGGHHRLGWVKIGLAIRLVQSLHLNVEPDSSLSPPQQEESRRVFWSVYLLDKFVSCGRSRPPSILDVDCTVALPCSEKGFLQEVPTDAPTLALMRKIPGNVETLKALDSFAILVLMCSTLGMTTRDTFQQDSSKIPCWDCESNFAKISSLLMTFEPIHTNSSASLGIHVVDKFGTYEGYDRQRAGHFIWARGAYHLSGCLLYHPLNLYGSRLAYGSDFPLSFARECLDRCTRHAEHLTNLLQTVLTTDCCARGSFLGYMAACAASIHKMYTYSSDQAISTKARTSLDVCLRFLEHQPVRWVNYAMMAAAVREFDLDPALARLLIDPLHVVAEPIAEQAQLDAIWNSIDYGLLTELDDKKQKGGGLSPLSAALEPFISSWPVF